MLGGDHYLIVGAGFSGAIIAPEIATHTDAQILIVDERTSSEAFLCAAAEGDREGFLRLSIASPEPDLAVSSR